MLARVRMADLPQKPADELDDLTLARARAGEPAAFRGLVERYQRRVHGVLFRMLDPSGRAAQVDDLFQETFLRVYRALPRYVPGPARLSTWILTIATRLALTELRRPLAQAPPPDVEQQAWTGEAPDAGIERRAAETLVRTALAALDPDHRAVLVLREIDELDYEEIARVLQINLGTVRSRLSRARARLREAFGEDPDA